MPVVKNFYTIISLALALIVGLLAGCSSPTGAGNPAGTITLATPTPSYSLQYFSNWPGTGTSTGFAPAASTFNGPTTAIVATSSLAFPNYTFAAWNTKVNSNGISYYPGATFPVTTDNSLYAVWLAKSSYSVDANGVLMSFTASSTVVTLPPGVTSVSTVFQGNTNITSISIPNGVMAIDSYAFKGCTNLSTVHIPSSVSSIGSQAFHNCINLTQVNLPEGLSVIPNNLFMYCNNLSSITLPQSVITIGTLAFACCSISSVIIPPNVTTINAMAFNSCQNLTSIVIPAKVTSIGSGTFGTCPKLENVYVLSTIPATLQTDGVSFSFSGNAQLLIHVPTIALASYKSTWVTQTSGLTAAQIVSP